MRESFQYVMDDWNWGHQFTASVVNYLKQNNKSRVTESYRGVAVKVRNGEVETKPLRLVRTYWLQPKPRMAS